MGLFNMFTRREGGPSKRLERLNAAPPGVRWQAIRPRRTRRPVEAELAHDDGRIDNGRGPMRYKAGEHYIVTYKAGDRAVVRRDLFERQYLRRADGDYEKRDDIVLRYFTLDRPVVVETLEGAERAEAGDWIVEGAAGELYPVSPGRAQDLYAEVGLH